MKRMVVLAAGLALAAAVAAAPRMKPGLWEMISTMEGAGMPSAMPPMTFRHCYRPEDIKDLRNTVPQKNPSCKVTDWKESGDTVTWKMACTGANAMTGGGRITYAGDRYTGVNTMTTSRGTMTQRYTARRVGECR